MKRLPYILAFLVAALGAGTAFAYTEATYPPVGYRAAAPPDQVLLAQRHVAVREAPRVVREAPPGAVAAQPMSRRFVMPPSGAIYQRGGVSRYQQPGSASRVTRMTAEERRALRQQINEANRGIYTKNGIRVVRP